MSPAEFTRAFGPILAADYAGLRHEPGRPDVADAYRAFLAEIGRQFESLPVIVEYSDNPTCYPDSSAMFADVQAGRLIVYASTAGLPSDHPLSAGHPVAGSYNTAFRAVHDYYGHFAGLHSFGPIGEERAYRRHSLMFSDAARPALATETRGQNSWFNCGPYAGLPVANRPFAEQKAGLLPAYSWRIV